MEEIRKRINEVVYDKHLSNRAFSAMVGMKPTSVNNYLNGTKTCTLELIARTSRYSGKYRQNGCCVARV